MGLPADSVEIRPAREADKPALAALLKASFLTTWSPLLPDAATQAFLRDKESEVFTEQCWQDFYIAETKDRIVGMVFVVGDHIESLHLDPEEKRKGYGAVLMDKAEALIRADGHRSSNLDVVVENDNAVSFYKARGYRIAKEFTGRESGDTPVQMYLMERAL